MRNSITTLSRHSIIFLGAFFFSHIFDVSGAGMNSCQKWTSRLIDVNSRGSEFRSRLVMSETHNFSSRNNADPWSISSLHDDDKLEAIRCLLGEEADVRSASMSGATRFDTSQIFATATANLAALYAISYIYNDRYDHASAVALRGEGASYIDESGAYATSPEAIKRAYIAYHEWFKKIQEIGLENARDAGLQPLDGSGLSWY